MGATLASKITLVGSVAFTTGMITFVHYKQWADLQALKNRKQQREVLSVNKYEQERDVLTVNNYEQQSDLLTELTPQQRANWNELQRQQSLKEKLENKVF